MLARVISGWKCSVDAQCYQAFLGTIPDLKLHNIKQTPIISVARLLSVLFIGSYCVWSFFLFNPRLIRFVAAWPGC